MTPLDIEILLHYHCSACEFGRLEAPACAETISEFMDEGIFRLRTEAENAETRPECTRTYALTERGEALVRFLCETPYPVQAWVRPA